MSNATKTTEHTPEPWEAGYYGCEPVGPNVEEWWAVWADGAPPGERLPALCYAPNAEANAERIAACVNACKGINPEAVPMMLKALKELAENAATSFGPAAEPAQVQAHKAKRLRLVNTARAAIAKAKAQP